MNEIIAELEMVKNNSTSIEYIKKLNIKLRELCSDDEVIDQLKQL